MHQPHPLVYFPIKRRTRGTSIGLRGRSDLTHVEREHKDVGAQNQHASSTLRDHVDGDAGSICAACSKHIIEQSPELSSNRACH